MKIYTEQIKLINKTPSDSYTRNYFLTHNGMYEVKNNKIIKYVIIETNKSLEIKNYTDNINIYVSHDILSYEQTTNHIPNNHIKLSIKYNKYNIAKNICIMEEIINGVKNRYIDTTIKLESALLQKYICTLVNPINSIC